ncbi:MAG: hypothetical protein GX780_00900 [Campylobacteraceae bacterium]|nr:hypothetical protein [Campylobacteraceae bacterium]
MNKIGSLLSFIIFFPLFVHSKAEWAFQYKFLLSKDEKAFIYVYNAKDEEALPETYHFSWTLFDDYQLVLHTRYRNFPKQHILIKERGKDSLKEKLLPDSIDKINSSVYLLLQFVDFDKEKNTATIEAYIHDRQKRIKVEFDDTKVRQDK